ncbi:putative RNase H-like nuclease [Bradyrhizobium sp. USDA 4341]
MRATGLDGFSKGWVAVSIDGDQRTISFHSDIADALARPFDRAGIDIPIGMTDDGERDCDRLARERLRPHTSRVFSGARRWLWQEFRDPDQANEEALRRGQTRVSRQLWHLGIKIMEADAFVRANAARDIREVHPELVFLRLNGDTPLPRKKSEEGDTLRRRLLKRSGFREIDRWLTETRIGTGAKRDDVLDACAVALAAHQPSGCVPEGSPPLDAHDLPMQIWF